MTEEEYRQEEVDQVLSGEPLIHERNPDTGEVRTRRRIEPVKEPIYVNEMAEAVRILQRIENKLDAAIGSMKWNMRLCYSLWWLSYLVYFWVSQYELSYIFILDISLDSSVVFKYNVLMIDYVAILLVILILLNYLEL